MSAIVACGGGGGGSKGGSGSNSNNGGGGQPTINVNVNSSNANANTNSNSNANTNNNSNLNLNTNVNSMMLAGLTLNLDASMLNTLKGIIDLANSTIKIAGTNDVAKIQTNATSGAMTLTFDNLKNIHAGENVTLDINDGTHTASAIVNTGKGGTGAGGTTTGSTGSGSGGTNSGGANNNGNSANGQNGQNGAIGNQGNGQGNNQGGQQQIELKVNGGVDKQTGNPIITTKPLTCKVDTIETPEHPQHNTGTGLPNGQGGQQNQQDGNQQQGNQQNQQGSPQNGQTAGDGLGTNGGKTITGKDGLTYDECVEDDAPGIGGGTGIGGLIECDKRPLVTTLSISINASNMSGMNLTNTTYHIAGFSSTPSAKLNRANGTIDFTFSSISGLHEGENTSIEFYDGIVNTSAKLVAKSGQLNETDVHLDLIPYGITGQPGIPNVKPVAAISCDSTVNQTTGDPNKPVWTGTQRELAKSISAKIGINNPEHSIINPNTVTYCELSLQASNGVMTYSVPVRMNASMFNESGVTKDFIKFVPAKDCEEVFDYRARISPGYLYCTRGGNSYAYPANGGPEAINATGDLKSNRTQIIRDLYTP